MALRGVECAPCRRAGHGCPAIANDGEPKCLDCMNEQPCAAVRCAGQVREESSTRAQYGGWGDVEFPDFQGEVLQRTPEELGLARVIPDVKPLPDIRADWSDSRQIRSSPAGLARQRERHGVYAMRVPKEVSRAQAAPVKRGPERSADWHCEQNALALAYEKSQQAVVQVIGGVNVKMAPAAMMGAELIDGFIAEREEEKEMPKHVAITETQKAAIAADAATMTYPELRAKHQLSKSSIERVLSERKIKPVLMRRGQHTAARERNAGRPAQLVHVDPRANGSAASLINALARVDGVDKLQLELTVRDVAQIVGRLTPEQRNAFLSAGLRAALLG